MQLKYRALSYKTSFKRFTITKTQTVAKYRGLNYFVSAEVENKTKSDEVLVYRGTKHSPIEMSSKTSNIFNSKPSFG